MSVGCVKFYKLIVHFLPCIIIVSGSEREGRGVPYKSYFVES